MSTQDPDERRDFRPLFTWRSAICDSDLPSTTRLVALTMALHMNERGGSCYPSATTLARETGLGESTVREHRGALEAAGWLELVERGGSKGERRRASAYEARIPPTPPAEGPVPEPNPSGSQASTPPGTGGHPSGSRTPSLPGTLQGTPQERGARAAKGEKPSSGAFEIAKTRKELAGTPNQRVDVVARAVQGVLDDGYFTEDQVRRAALSDDLRGLRLTDGSLRLAAKKIREADTRERQRVEEADLRTPADEGAARYDAALRKAISEGVPPGEAANRRALEILREVTP